MGWVRRRWGMGEGRETGRRREGVITYYIDLSGFIQVLGKLVCVRELERTVSLKGRVTGDRHHAPWRNFADSRVQSPEGAATGLLGLWC